jgi:hypothetical protein
VLEENKDRLTPVAYKKSKNGGAGTGSPSGKRRIQAVDRRRNSSSERRIKA